MTAFWLPIGKIGLADRVYLDTWCIGLIISDVEAEKREGQAILRRFSSGYAIIVPQAAVGEMVSVVMAKHRSDSLKLKAMMGTIAVRLVDFLEPDQCLPSVDSEILTHAQYFMQECGVDPTDALITAHAMNDPDSVYFITADSKILTNDKVYAYEESLRESGKRRRELKITDSP